LRGICTCYGWSTNDGAVGNIDDKSFVLGDTYAYIYIKDTSYTSAADFKSAVTGQILAYELATPTTEAVTPTNLPIKSLFGYNHIESSTGDLDITYITEGYHDFVDEIESTYGRRKGGKKPIDVFRMLEGNSEPKEEEGEKEEQKEEIKK
jgi:hypothetical protein